MPKYLLAFFLSILLAGSNVNAQSRSLDYYLEAGLKNSPLLKDLNYQILSTGLDSLIVKAGGMPQVNLASQALYAPASTNFGYDSAITNGGNYAGLVSAVQPIINGHLKQVRYQEVSVLYQSLQANVKITEIDLKKNISSQFLTAYSDYSKILFNQTLLTLLQEQESTLKQLVERGIYQETDAINLTLSIRAQKINIEQSNIQFRNDLGLLNFICGITDTSSAILQSPDITLKNDFNISNSPLMTQFRIDSLRNVTNKLLIDVSYRPKLNAFADAGFNAINPKNIPNNFGTSIGLNFSVPIYDGRQRNFQYNKIELNEKSRLSQLEFYTRQFDQQHLQLIQQLKLTDELIYDIRNQVSDQHKLIELYKAEIEKGLVRLLDFLIIVNNYSATQNNLKQAEIDRMQIINQMNYLK